MDSDIELIIDEIIKCKGKERDVAIDAFFEIIKEENLPVKIMAGIYELFKKCPNHNSESWMISSNVTHYLEAALRDSEFSQLLTKLESILK